MIMSRSYKARLVHKTGHGSHVTCIIMPTISLANVAHGDDAAYIVFDNTNLLFISCG